jgi:Rap1a immunity proteins
MPEDFSQGRCIGIVETLVNFGSMLPDGRAICKPNSVTIGVAVGLVVKYIAGDASRGNENFWEMANQALVNAWPCNSQRR